ncbi:uncharacterized protein [Hetaerina americana]|uniref:uncharacterized protein n=1 Tax=Hetaerina americana TaxID=62018 RepID=UPI003A7F448C
MDRPSLRASALLLTPAAIAAAFALLLSASDAAEAPADASQSSRQNPVALGYYNLIITEYSYKFWAAFMVATLVILIYSCLAAIWVAHTVYLPPPISYDEYDYLAKRSASEEEDEMDFSPSGGWADHGHPSPRTTRRILRAIAQPPLPT